MNFLHPACDVLEEEDNTERKVDYVDILKYSWDNVEGALTRNNLGTKSTKHIDDILVEEKTKNYIINYISKWKNATSLFSTLGITYKLGILLYGPPGTGKTSMAKAIAAHFDYPLYIVDMSSFCPDMATAISEHSMRSNRIILFEDIDYIFGKREQDRTPEEKANGQAILQLLDGASSASNVIFIATTNAKDSLDPALVRDGRFDLKAYMGDLDKEYAVKMCNSMTITDEDKQNELLSNLEFPVNPAHLQNLIVQYIFNHLDDSAENKKESETSKTSSEKVKNKTGDRRLAPFIL